MTTQNPFNLSEHQHLIQVVGDVMAPTLHTGDFFIADYDDVDQADGLFYVEGVNLKGAYRVQVVGDIAHLHGDNPAYPAKQFPMEELIVFAKINRLINVNRV